MKKDVLNKMEIAQKLNIKTAEITVLETVDSTNRYLKSVLDETTPEYTMVIAENQTAGRGRFARKFHSPEGSGIYMSILLKPQFNIGDSVLLTAAAAVAVSDAIEELSEKGTKIKWVNDVLINSKKVCGILCEGVINPETSTLDSVILGIGINVYKPENGFADEIKDIATHIFDEEKTDRRNTLIAKVINNLEKFYKELQNRTFLEKYRERSSVIGKDILVLKGEETVPAKALEIDNNCRLKVQFKNGNCEYLSSGEISIKTKF